MMMAAASAALSAEDAERLLPVVEIWRIVDADCRL
jgi:hypothetical protein